jgi:peptide/nickel transport system substrate-binding protein
VPETNSRVLGFRNGDFDIMAYVPQNEAASIEATEGVTLEVQPIYRLDYVFLNHQDPIIGNRDFRLALNYAVDRSVLMDLIYFGYGEIPNSYMPKMSYWSADVPLIPYDPAKAQELVASSGYAGEMLTITIDAGASVGKQLATILQQMWMAVGINTQIQEVDPSSSFGLLAAGEYQISPGYITSDINDDDELASIMAISESSDFHAFFTWYDNPEVTAWLNQARESADPAERAELYAKIQEQVYYNDAYSIPLNFSPVLHAYYDYVKGFRTLSTGWWWLAKVWLDQ